MQRFLLFTAVAAVAAVYFSGNQDLLDIYLPQQSLAAEDSAGAPPAVQQASQSMPGQEEIAAGPGGHFTATFQVNGRSVNGLIDTGATVVAINETTARRIGISVSSLDYRYAVTTANGATKAAHITLNRIDLGSLRVKDVDAFVLKDQSLSGMLVGMSFMNKLKSYKVQDGVLYLKN